MSYEWISEVTIIWVSRLLVMSAHFHHRVAQSPAGPGSLDHGFHTSIYHLLLVYIDLFLELQSLATKMINTEQKSSPGYLFNALELVLISWCHFKCQYDSEICHLPEAWILCPALPPSDGLFWGTLSVVFAHDGLGLWSLERSIHLYRVTFRLFLSQAPTFSHHSLWSYQVS